MASRKLAWLALGGFAIAVGCSSKDDSGAASGSCGDGTCNWWEDAKVCPADCGTCGNGVCDPGEDPSSCAQDCAIAVPDRGDPSTFPTECLATCAEACTRLTSCGAVSSPGFPIQEAECLSRCAFAEAAGWSGDISGPFKCCASQTDCAAVAQCGGWLQDPAVVASCTRYCECRMAGAVAVVTAGHEPPDGYRFAPDLLMLDPDQASVDLSRLSGVHVLRDGRLKLVQLDATTTPATLGELNKVGRVLPTLLDSAGRVSAANGRVVLIAGRPDALAMALPIAEHHGLGLGHELNTRLKSEPAARLYVLEGVDPWQSLDAASELSEVPGLRAELDQVRHYELRYAPNDPLFGDQWHLANSGQKGSTASVDGRVSEAWDLTMGDASVLIAINDDGIDLNHPEFAGKLEPALGFPADWETQMEAGNFAGHGTSVAGVAAAKADNAQGGAGVCPNCRLLPHLLGASSGGSFTVSDTEVAQGFTDMVDAGAWIISNSWGYDTGDPVYAGSVALPSLASVVKASFDNAETAGRAGLGTVILFAAGNSNAGLDPMTAYVTNLSVSAVDDLGLKPYYSSFGPENDIAAPSNGGLNSITTTAAGSQYTPNFGGTSSACPFISGVVGLILSADPTLTAAEVRQILASTATKIDPVFGQWNEQGHSDFHGAGLVNAYAAVELALGGCASPELCVAPSDDCGATCGTLTTCEVCRTHADCAPGHKCQALPSLGRMVCVAAKGVDSCPDGTSEVNGYCLPTPATCGVCSDTEVCNGRDDNCDGAVDEGSVCQGGSVCFIDAPGCGAGQICAGRRCLTECSDAATDCAANQTCDQVKTQYGEVPGPKACNGQQSQGGACQSKCEVRASTLADDGLAAFVACMQDGAADCSVINTCRALFPGGQ